MSDDCQVEKFGPKGTRQNTINMVTRGAFGEWNTQDNMKEEGGGGGGGEKKQDGGLHGNKLHTAASDSTVWRQRVEAFVPQDKKELSEGEV